MRSLVILEPRLIRLSLIQKSSLSSHNEKAIIADGFFIVYQ